MEMDSDRPTERQLYDRRIIELQLIEPNVMFAQ